MFGQISQYHGLVKLTHKINHHSSHEVLTLLFSLSSWLHTLWAEEVFKYDSLSLWCFPRFLHAPPWTTDCTSHDLCKMFPFTGQPHSDLVFIVVSVAVIIVLNAPCSLFDYIFPFRSYAGRILNGSSVALFHLVIFVPTKLPLLLLTG